MNRMRFQRGFTIVELLIVVVVIAILAAISIVAYNGIQDRAHNTAIQSDLQSSAKKMEQYRILHGSYPETITQFRQAELSFSLGSYIHAVYCQAGEGNQAKYAFVAMSASEASYMYTSQGGRADYTGVWDSAPPICERVGVTAAETDIWLKGSGDWTSWVVY